MVFTIKQARKLSDKTQEQMAKALKVHVQTYRKIEMNPQSTTYAQAKKIAELTGLSVDSIFFA